jgi:hypothetical protein
MDKGSDSSGSSSGSGLIMLLLAAVGVVFVATKPLESSRPALPEPQAERRQAAQDVEARLWQDPFSAVAKAREAAQKKPPAGPSEREQHNVESFAAELQQQMAAAKPTGHTVLLAVMLYGGPYAERVESRLRTRYAVLAGLSARGFVPTDSEHLGYFYPQSEKERRDLPETVPFETFERGLRPSERGGDCKDDCRVVVLWLDSTAFYTEPLRRLASLAERIHSKLPTPTDAGPPVRWRVLGPSSSDGLRALVREVSADPAAARRLDAFDIRFFSGLATAPDDALMKPDDLARHGTLSAYLASRGVPLLRTIGTDDLLARALVRELELRGLRPRPAEGETADRCPDQDAKTSEWESHPERRPSSIAIVSEWDTLYGRTLREQFRYRAGNGSTPTREGYCVTRWHYVRGLDGRLPGDAAPASDNRAKKDSRSEGADSIGREGSYFERPEGQSQFDYLRRLASRMREEDARLRRVYGPENGIRAIGVLGNDVYDKLLVLQTLHAELPHAVFFTTDLDARLFHPSEQTWARNLIVASNFGLRLSGPLQREFAPFRDSYQTSSYLSTVLAMADVRRAISGSGIGPPLTQERIHSWFEQPRLFEVTRSGVFDFSAAPRASDPERRPLQAAAASASAPESGGRRAPQCGRRAPELCEDAEIHAYVSPMTPEWSPGARFLITGTLMLALWLPALALSRDRQRRLRRYVARGGASPRRRALQASKLFGGLVALAIVPPLLLSWAWPALADWITQQGAGKPLSFVDGISPWPTYAIRIGTFVLCIYLAVRAWSSLATNIDQIAREFRLGATRRHFHALLETEHQRRTIWQRLAAMLTVAFYRERPGLLGSHTGMTPAAVTFWKHYILQNRAGARVFRTGLCMVLMLLLSGLIANALGDPPLAPQRGPLTAFMQRATSLPPALAIQFLIFYVVDATVLCVFFMRGLRLHHANWPDRTLQTFHTSTGVPVEYLDDWIDLQFIARRTRAIGALIYFPFIGLSLMLLARSSFFDDWYTPPTVLVLATLSIAIVLGCALALRRSAEASRLHAIQRLRDAILRAKGAGNGTLVGQLETLRDRAERLSDGAFAPYSRQPLLKAVLLPVLTFGGSSLFDYLAMLNL